MEDFVVRDISALGALRLAVLDSEVWAEETWRAADAAIRSLMSEITIELARRQRALDACRSQENADCSHEYARVERAQSSLRQTQSLAEEVAGLHRAYKQRMSDLRERTERRTHVIERQMDHVQRNPDSGAAPAGGTGSDRGASIGGVALIGANTDASSGGSGLLPAGTSRARIADLPIDPGLDQPKGGASWDDMVWAATTFKEVILPGIARGLGSEDFARMDLEQGNEGFRRLGGAHDLYWRDPPVLCRDSSGTLSFTHGRHRAEAARRAGLTWIPAKLT